MLNLSHFLRSKTSAIYIVCCSFIVLVYLLTENTDISVYELVADPNEVGRLAPYTGLVSTLGTLILAATASVCLFSAYLIGCANSQAKKWNLFFRFSGYFILLLLADDVWQIHENFPSILFDLEPENRLIQDLCETIMFGIYALLFAAYLSRFKKLFFQTKLNSFVFAVSFLLLSTIIDIFLANISGHFILEEGLKLLGIVSLSIYYFEVSFRQVRQFLISNNIEAELHAEPAEPNGDRQLFKSK